MSAILEAQDIQFEYRQNEPVLREINLLVTPGTNVGIVGESGSGKSTLLRLLLGILKPTRGNVIFSEKELSLSDRTQALDFRRHVQVIFQDPYSSLDPRQRIDKLIAEPLISLGMARSMGGESRRSRQKWVEEKVVETLHAVGLSADSLKRYPSEFSGGQRQRIAIARAIICNPRILLADEPVSALDVSTRVRIIELLKELSETRGETIIMVSHDLAVVAALCKETVVLEKGRIVEQGNTSQVLGNPTQLYTQKLIGSLPRLTR